MLTAGTYTTQTFEPGLTYTVTHGWSNYEDLPGNFLLLPPGVDLAGVDAGTADFIGAYDGVAAASADCAERPQADVETTAEAIATWLASADGLTASEPQAVSVGGRDGLVFDVELAVGYTEGCPYPDLEGIPMVPMLIGNLIGPASLHHVVMDDTVTRLYLLEGPPYRTIAIEINDARGGMSLEELDAVVEEFQFERP